MWNHEHIARSAGFTMIELIVVMALFAVISGIAVSNLRELESPLSNSAFGSSHYLRLVRARAISTTSYIRVDPANSSSLIASRSDQDDCGGTVSAISDLTYTFEEGVTLGATDWYLCFTPRGLSDEHVSFSFSSDAGTRTMQVALGGGVKVE